MSSTADAADPLFRDLGLPAPLLAALEAVGYETPSAIQARTIPPLLEGRDVLGQAQTGTGKTAAFALPVLARLDLGRRAPQALVLAPTRELAIQVAEAFQKYAAQMPGFHVLPIYGGQPYEPQLKGLRRGPQVVVGTPGRVVDHIKRGSLKVDQLGQLVLDEADEMLRMGFIEDVEWVLQQLPQERQIALFSATMPPAIRRVAQTYLHEPVEISIEARTTTGANIRQRYWLVSGLQKLEALTRFLEVEPFDGMIVFARTKAATTELAEKLEARGYSARALNGDLPQADRERTVQRFRDGAIDIIVATDVAARGIDVERVSHVVNYDIPTDTESYVHRIGRTGRAGRSGEAILFVSPRERHLLRQIERATRQPIEAIPAPSSEAINARRIERFKQTISDLLGEAGSDAQIAKQLDGFRAIVSQVEAQTEAPLLDIAAALAVLSQNGRPLRVEAAPAPTDAAAPASPGAAMRRTPERAARKPESAPATDTETYRVEVGAKHGVKPGNLVGAIANEAGLDSEFIGRIEIFDEHSLVHLPTGMPKGIFKDLQKTWVCGRQLRISRLDQERPVPRKHRSAR